MILYIDACAREASRTRHLAERLLRWLDGPVQTVRLAERSFPAVDEAFLRRRDALRCAEAWEDPLFRDARDFAAADGIVIAAPYWDLSFPAALKQYFEQISVLGLTFRYVADDVPQGLCRARRLYYVSTAGGTVVSDAFDYGYVRALARGFYGIRETELFRAEKLDLAGADAEVILRQAEAEIDRRMAALTGS